MEIAAELGNTVCRTPNSSLLVKSFTEHRQVGHMGRGALRNHCVAQSACKRWPHGKTYFASCLQSASKQIQHGSLASSGNEVGPGCGFATTGAPQRHEVDDRDLLNALRRTALDNKLFCCEAGRHFAPVSCNSLFSSCSCAKRCCTGAGLCEVLARARPWLEKCFFIAK
jgi:hypothetical protein